MAGRKKGERPMQPEHIHQCELLEYESRYLELAFPGDPQAQRWTLRHAVTGRPLGDEGDRDTVFMQVCFFCPGCGMDLRDDVLWQIAGKPTFNEMMKKAREEGQDLKTNWVEYQ